MRKLKPLQNRKLNRAVFAEKDHQKAMRRASIGPGKTDVELLASRWKEALNRMAKPRENSRPIPNYELHKKSLENIKAKSAEFICRAMQSWDYEKMPLFPRPDAPRV